MAHCVQCYRDVDNGKIFGVIQKSHYDNRTTTADIDSGADWFKPVALIKVGACEYCSKDLLKKSLLSCLKLLGVAVVLLVIGGIMGSGDNVPDSTASAAGITLLIGLLCIVASIGSAILSLIRKANGRIAVLGIENKLKAEWILAPKDEGDIDLLKIEKSNYNRYSQDYIYVPESKLKKPLKTNPKPNSKAAALNTLKQYYSEL